MDEIFIGLFLFSGLLIILAHISRGYNECTLTSSQISEQLENAYKIREEIRLETKSMSPTDLYHYGLLHNDKLTKLSVYIKQMEHNLVKAKRKELAIENREKKKKELFLLEASKEVKSSVVPLTPEQIKEARENRICLILLASGIIIILFATFIWWVLK